VKDSTGVYLREIGRIPLLTHEQEIDYGKLVQKMMRLLEAKDALTNKLHREPTVSEWVQDIGLSEAELNLTFPVKSRKADSQRSWETPQHIR